MICFWDGQKPFCLTLSCYKNKQARKQREKEEREREKEKLKGMRMLLAFIALLSHPWHEQQLVCMVTSAFTWL